MVALIVVDVQNDFLPGGRLAVPEGDRILPVVNEYLDRFVASGSPVYASRDWHKEDSEHFHAWPPHCIQGSQGATFPEELALPTEARIISKGMEGDGYSAFEGILDRGEGLGDSLKRDDVQELYLCGLATDYCVRATALEACRLGYRVTVLIDACLGVNLKPHDSEAAIAEMVGAGARLATRETLSL